MEVVYLQSDQMATWDRFVSSHQHGGLYHQSHWRKVLENAYPHMKGHFLALRDSKSNEIVAGLPLYEVRSWILGNRLVSVPYSNWCDPLVSNDEQLKLLLGGALELQETLSSKRIEVRFRAVKQLPLMAGWTVQKTWKHHSVSLAKSETELWGNLSRTAVRQLVRKAERNKVEIVAENSLEALSEFYDAFVVTRQRLALPIVPYRYFTAIYQGLPNDERTLLIARHQGKFMGAVLALKACGVFHLEFAADRQGARQLGVMQLLYWRALQIARLENHAEFSFGRTAMDNGGLIAYKRHWNPVEEELSVCTWGGAQEREGAQNSSVAKSLVGSVLKRAPRPLCKIFGTFVYRHWG